ncbi:glycosyltransferase family 4 protein [Luteibacter sp. 329MFSha]|uniref:glycosyltransferase family 4 protein n=1 Tax=Luteibacter sp. 329MFSha TaxID=1798239 RepID=UPI0008D8128B|nr:glycosyltransferase family 4 protein [Luteibacter sp. 329MFSha]SEV97589.1 Glycosyltransferase involved in cell wall bisynthesis [Luteibacter sp. 329MFSha]
MKIAFIDSWPQSSIEGSGTAIGIRGLRNALTDQGERVSVMSPRGTWPRNTTARRLFFNAALPLRLDVSKHDIVVGFDYDGFLCSGRTRKVPYIVSIKGVLAEEARHERGRTRAVLRALSLLERHNARRADIVVTTSHYCRKAIVEHYGVLEKRIRLVPEGIDLDHWRRVLLSEHRRDTGATILCVARQYPRKHVADLLHAMPLIRRVIPGARAVIVGNGPEHGNLMRMRDELRLGDVTTLLGNVADDDTLIRLYRHADVFCLPSIQEGFGIVFLEAMASELPIVATSACAIPEVVPHGRAGWLVPPGDVASLAHALIRLLTDPSRREAYGRQGLAHVQRYDWKMVAKRFADAIGSDERSFDAR